MQLLEPEVGVDVPESNFNFQDVYEKARIACNTALELNQRGMPIEIDKEDELFAERIIKEEISIPANYNFSAGTAVKLGALLQEYDVQVAKSAAQLRTVSTNKLIEMLDDPDPKVRLKAIELIGKIADVGLFAERTEITINHKSTIELQQELAKLVSDYVDVETKLVTSDTEEEEEEDGAPREEEEGEGAGTQEGDAEAARDETEEDK
jgi:hypothetical protein